MTTTSLQRFEPMQPDCPAADPIDQQQGVVEEVCLTGLSMLGGLLFLVLLLVVVKLLYYGLTMQNEMFVLPSTGAS